MPPKARYTKQEIVEKAISLIKKQGMEKLTARELASEMGTSSKPIFIAFENMEDLKKSTFDYAMNLYIEFQEKYYEPDPFLKCGKTYIAFAIEEPNLFQFLFMRPRKEILSFAELMRIMDFNYEKTIKMISETCGVTLEQADMLYKNMWLYSHSIATLCASKQCTFSPQEVEVLLKNTYEKFARFS